MNKKIFWITRTAILIAVLIVSQIATAPFGNTLITGSLVNLVLVVSVMTSGMLTGLTVASLSPVFAKIIGIGPLWSIIPFIMLGNIIFVIIWHFIGNQHFRKKHLSYIIAMVIAAVSKFLILYVGIVRITVPFLLSLPEPQASVISMAFSIPQLITALIGGALAILVVPTIKKATKGSSQRNHNGINKNERAFAKKI